MSTEATVRAALVTAIQSIAVASLGMPDTTGVFPYVADYVDAANVSSFFNRNIGGRIQTRAVGVQVLSTSEQIRDGTGNRYSRMYEALIRMYYSLRTGADVNTVIDHARAIRGQVKTLGIRISNTVDRIEEMRPLSLQIAGAESGRIVVADIVYILEKFDPTF